MYVCIYIIFVRIRSGKRLSRRKQTSRKKKGEKKLKYCSRIIVMISLSIRRGEETWRDSLRLQYWRENEMHAIIISVANIKNVAVAER